MTLLYVSATLTAHQFCIQAPRIRLIAVPWDGKYTEPRLMWWYAWFDTVMGMTVGTQLLYDHREASAEAANIWRVR